MTEHKKTIMKRIAAGLLFMFGLAAFPSLSTLLCFAAVALILYENKFRNKRLHKWGLGLCILLALIIVPTTDTPATEPAPATEIPAEAPSETVIPATPEENTEARKMLEPIPETQLPTAEPILLEPIEIQASTPSVLTVHYIDVGQGDAALLTCAGKTMLIDGGRPEYSSKIVAYLKSQGIQQLDYIVASHAHEDHVGGLAGALNACSAMTALSPVKEYDNDAFRDFCKYAERQGISVTAIMAGGSFYLGDSTVSILGPSRYHDDHNDDSLVIRVCHGENSFLFTGDANNEAELDVIETGAYLESTVLKVGHHGSSGASGYRFLRSVNPQYAIISCGLYNSYGHPAEATLSRLNDQGANIYRTDLHGTVVCTSDGQTLSFQTEKQPETSSIYMSGEELENRHNAETTVKEAPISSSDGMGQTYIGNKNSHILHYPTCGTLPHEKNRVYFDSREAAVGYRPCENCNP